MAIGADTPAKWKMGAVDLAGRVVIGPQYDGMGYFSEGLASARRDGKFGYIDRDGKVAITFQFERAFQFQSARAVVFGGPGGQSGLIDKTGTFIARFEFDTVSEFSEGFAVVSTKGSVKGKSYGVIDFNGDIVIPARFTHVGGASDSNLNARRDFLFSEGLLAVSEGHGFGYIDRQGQYVIPPQYLRASAFRGGLAVVEVRAQVGIGDPAAKGQLAGLIDRSGQLVTSPIYDWIKIKSGGLPQVKFGNRLGYLDAKGQPLTFSAKDVEDYVKQKRDELKPPPPPPPGRAVVADAGSAPYYLHLPETLCALDLSAPQDRKIIDDLEAAKKKIPEAPEEVWSHLKSADGTPKANSGLILSCDQLEKARAGGGGQVIPTYIVASGTQKDRYDRSANAALGLVSAIACRMMDRDSTGVPRTLTASDPSVRVWTAFKRLDAGEATALPALASEPLACYSAWVMPAAADRSATRPAPPKASVRFHTMFLAPDWLIQIVTDTSAEAPEALFRELQHEQALVRAFAEANFKKPSPRP